MSMVIHTIKEKRWALFGAVMGMFVFSAFGTLLHSFIALISFIFSL